jgi:multiple sugar transport system ATP-binding protein
VCGRGGGLLGFRPENVLIAPSRAPGDIACTIDFIEPMGSETFLHLRSGGSPLVARVAADQRFACGESVALRVDFSKACFFDSESGERIESNF